MAAYCAEFGRWFKERRRNLGVTLRAFCRVHGLDHGNMSKIERGLLKPPTGQKLEEYLSYLGIEPETDEWYQFRDVAHACAGEVPETIMRDEELVKKLPMVFRTMARQNPSDEHLQRLVEILRKS